MKKIFNRIIALNFFKSEFIKNSFTLFLGTTIAQLLSVLLYPVFSRIYTPEQFGTFALFTSITGILALMSSGVYELAIILPKEENKALSLLILVFILTFINCLFLVFIILLFKNFFAIRLFNNPQIEAFLVFIPLSVFFNNIYAAFSYYANRKKQYILISQSSINQGVGMNLSKLFFGLVNFTKGGLIIGKIIGQFSSAFQLFIQVSKKNGFNHGRIKQAYKYIKQVAVIYKNFPVFRLPHSLMNTFSTALPVFILNKYFTPHDAGQYTLAAGVLLTPVLLIVGSVSKVMNQKIIEKIHNKVPVFNEIIRMLRIMMPVIGVFFILLFFFSEIIFVFLFGKEWQDAGKIAGIILPWVFLVLFVSPFSFMPDIFYKQRKAMLIDMGYLFLRIMSMATGVYYKNYLLAVLLFVLSGCLVLSYCLLWYLSLLKKHEKLMSKP